jgi:hypothetical protein
MKLIEAAGKAWKVVLFKSKKEIFSDEKEACIRFIKGFDKASKDYVDLRLIAPDSREYDWHKNKFTSPQNDV